MMKSFLQKSMHMFLLYQQFKHDNIMGHKLKLQLLFYAATWVN